MQLKFDIMEIQMCRSIWSILSSRNSSLAEKEFVLPGNESNDK